MEIALFTFNPFAENTYILSDASGECIIIDPGMSNPSEQAILMEYLKSNDLTLAKLVNTHCHIDHVLGNRFIADQFDLKLWAHEGEKVVLEMQPMISQMYQIEYDPSPLIEEYLVPGEYLTFGESRLKILFVPGHSPASVALYHSESKQLIAGDVLFEGSIGRTDLPGGNHETLINSIKNELLVLDDEVRVYPGHGASTTIGVERRSNPFLV